MQTIKIDTTISQPVEKVWEYFNSPEHITKWNFATDEWHCPHAENNLATSGKFTYRMEAKDGSAGFDFAGTFDKIVPNERIEYHLDDNRKVQVLFEALDENTTKVTQIFEVEENNDAEMQRQGWQLILDNFKKYAESDS